jgi:hypothetical protein
MQANRLGAVASHSIDASLPIMLCAAAGRSSLTVSQSSYGIAEATSLETKTSADAMTFPSSRA